MICAAGKGSDGLLRGSFPTLYRNALAAGYDRTTILLGLNNGFMCDEAVHDIADRSNARVTELWAGPKESPAHQAQITMHPNGLGQEYELKDLPDAKSNLVVVNQPETEYSPGKVRMLSDLYGLAVRNAIAGWKTPAYTVNIDAESQVLEPGRKLRATDLQSNGLLPFREEVDRQREANGTEVLGVLSHRTAYTKYDDGREMPDFHIPVARVHRAHNLTHGHGHSNHLVGAFYGADTSTLLAASNVATTHCPGGRAEDSVVQNILHFAGVKHDVTRKALVTNRVPPLSDREGTLGQMVRQHCAGADMAAWYGIRTTRRKRDILWEKLYELWLLRGNLVTFVSEKLDNMEVRNRAAASKRNSLKTGQADWPSNFRQQSRDQVT